MILIRKIRKVPLLGNALNFRFFTFLSTNVRLRIFCQYHTNANIYHHHHHVCLTICEFIANVWIWKDLCVFAICDSNLKNLIETNLWHWNHGWSVICKLNSLNISYTSFEIERQGRFCWNMFIFVIFSISTRIYLSILEFPRIIINDKIVRFSFAIILCTDIIIIVCSICCVY